MKGFVQYVKTKFQKHPVKLDTYQENLQKCLDTFDYTEEECHERLSAAADALSEGDDETLEYIILFVIIGLVGYGGYKYFNK